MEDYFDDYSEYGEYRDDLEEWERDRLAEDLAAEAGDYGDPEDWDEDPDWEDEPD
jgi:hypothetical protein